MVNKNQVGLAVGLFLAIIHAVWSLLIAVIPTQFQSFLDWVFQLHSLVPYLNLTAFNLLNAVILVIVTFVMGYIFGWVFAWCHNLMHKKK